MTEQAEVLLAKPRGFCAGVDRAIEIVERALALHGAPIYVRHEIVHNSSWSRACAPRGAVFVEELARCPRARPDLPARRRRRARRSRRGL